MSYNGIGLPAIGTIVRVNRDIGSTHADALYKLIIPEGSHVKVIAHSKHSKTGVDLAVIEYDAPGCGTYIRQLVSEYLSRIKTVEEMREESVRSILEGVGINYDAQHNSTKTALLTLHQRGKLSA